MNRDWRGFIARLSYRRVLLLGLFCAIVFEAVTVVLRFAFSLQSKHATGALGAYTFGLRIHHGYLGVLVVVVALWLRPPWLRKLLLIVAIGLLLSDLFHHFLVLWPLTGSPDFDIFYPPRNIDSTSARVGAAVCVPWRVTEIAAAALARRTASRSGNPSER